MSWILTVLTVVLWILGGLLALVLAIMLLMVILAIAPIRYNVKISTMQPTTALVKVSYFFRLIYFVYEYNENKSNTTLRILGFRKKLDFDNLITEKKTREKKTLEKKNNEKKVKPKEKKSSKDRGIIETIQSVLTYPQRKTIMDMCMRTMKKYMRIIKPKKFNISGVIGLADPASTGFFLGMYEAVAGVLGIRRSIRLSGDFESESVTARLNIIIEGRVSFARLSIPFVWLALQKPVRRLIWGAIFPSKSKEKSEKPKG